MLDLMSKPKKSKPSRDRGPVLFLRLPEETEAAILAYIAAQDVPPDKTAVGLAAIHEFLAKRGFWPPKRGA